MVLCDSPSWALASSLAPLSIQCALWPGGRDTTSMDEGNVAPGEAVQATVVMHGHPV